MKKRVCHGISLLLTLALAGCAYAEAAPMSKPWPTHAPDATPYVRVYSEAEVPRAGEDGRLESTEVLWSSIYEEFGCFYAKKDELEMFRSLPQDEPFSFVPHSARFHLDKTEAMRMARLFSEKEGCAVRVKALYQLVDGLHERSYIAVVTMTPARMFELSEEMDESFMIEQLYAAVDERFDQVCWDGSPLDEQTWLDLAYEKVGSFYMEAETYRYFQSIPQNEQIHVSVRSGPTPNRTEAEAIADMTAFADADCDVSVFQYRPGPGGEPEYLCVVTVTPEEMFRLSGEMDRAFIVDSLNREIAQEPGPEAGADAAHPAKREGA